MTDANDLFVPPADAADAPIALDGEYVLRASERASTLAARRG
jgi:hypothetical protein